MKKLFLHIAILSLFFAALPAGAQYVLDNTGGKINNKGTIKINSGQVHALNDTIGGRVEFLQSRSTSQQSIPNIVYHQLVIKNDARKIVLDERDVFNNVRPLIVLDSLIIADNANFTTRWIGLNPEDIITRSSVTNTSRYDGPRDIIMQNSIAAQDLIGNGRFSRLNVDNPYGVNVVGGGFTIEEQLTLTRGEIRNSESANFAMADSATIIRDVGGSIAETANFEGRIDVRYRGEGAFISTGELPKTEENLQRLIQENSSDLVLSHNVQVNDSLYVGGRFFTVEDTLTLATSKNTVFNQNNADAEISGTIRLTNVRTDSTKMLLHNPLTYALFRNELAAAGTSELIVTVRPFTFPAKSMGDTKVRRSFEIKGKDSDGNLLEKNINMHFGYAWRYFVGDSSDENRDLQLNQLVLQHWNAGFWNDVISSDIAFNNQQTGWAWSYATNVDNYGSFAIGVSGGLMTMSAKVFLEGAYRYGSMADDLRQRGYFQMPPPDVYPYNLDPMRQFYITEQLPDSVVDWVVVEFREALASAGKIRTYLVKQDGRLVDLYNNDVLVLTGGVAATRLDSGDYYIAIRHRNHLALVTKDYVKLLPGTTRLLDFTEPSFVMGGIGSLKRVEKLDDGSYIYGMIAGNVNGSIMQSGRIDANDYNNIIPNLSSQINPLFDGYLIGDMNMDGIITTKDFNISFNNRNRVSALP